METSIKKNFADKQLGSGVIILVIGAAFLLRNMGLDIPGWIFSWYTILLGIGLWMGYRKNYQGSSWLALTLIGGFFTLNDITIFDFDLSKITTAIILIGLGLYVILKPKRNKNFEDYFKNTNQDTTEIKS